MTFIRYFPGAWYGDTAFLAFCGFPDSAVFIAWFQSENRAERSGPGLGETSGERNCSSGAGGAPGGFYAGTPALATRASLLGAVVWEPVERGGSLWSRWLPTLCTLRLRRPQLRPGPPAGGYGARAGGKGDGRDAQGGGSPRALQAAAARLAKAGSSRAGLEVGGTINPRLGELRTYPTPSTLKISFGSPHG